MRSNIRAIVVAIIMIWLFVDPFNSNGQGNYYFVVETRIASGDNKLTPEATYTVSYFNGVIQTLYEDSISTEYRYYGKDTVFVFYKERSGKVISGIGTSAEMRKYLSKQVDHKYKKIRIQQTGLTDVIMGVPCAQSLIEYEHKYLTLEMKFENTISYSFEKKVDKELATGNITHIWMSSNYIDSLKRLEGFIMKQMIKHDNRAIAEMEVVNFVDAEKDHLKPLYYFKNAQGHKKLASSIRNIQARRKSGDSFQRLNEPRH